MGTLTRAGYKIEKTYLKDEGISLKKQLSVKPYVSPVFVRPQYVKPYMLYKETENFLYIPKQFGIHRFGSPKTDMTEILKSGGGKQASFEYLETLDDLTLLKLHKYFFWADKKLHSVFFIEDKD